MSHNPAATCRKKKVYATMQAVQIRAVMDCMNFKRLMSVYECEVCGKYHLTSRYWDTARGVYAWPAC